jgi:type I restriction enzyme S subunit
MTYLAFNIQKTIKSAVPKGIGHMEFKDSPLGLIPMAWNVMTLKDVCTRITDGTHQAVQTTETDSIPFLFVSCIKYGKILWDKASKITDQTYEAASKGRRPLIGDILYTAVGSYGNAALVLVNKKFSFQRHIAFIQPNHKLVSSNYLVSYLNSSFGKNQADHYAIGNAQLTVTLGNLGLYKIPLPPNKEQIIIASIMEGIEIKFDSQIDKLNQLFSLKKALMQDLLTGKVRVKIPPH